MCRLSWWEERTGVPSYQSSLCSPALSPHPQDPRGFQWDQGYTWASLTVSATLRPCTRTFMGSM